MRPIVATKVMPPVQALPIARCVAAVCRAESTDEVAAGLKVGDVFDQSNWPLAKELLPPEILRHYQRGEYRNRIIAFPTGKMKWEQSFVHATEQNAACRGR